MRPRAWLTAAILAAAGAAAAQEPPAPGGAAATGEPAAAEAALQVGPARPFSAPELFIEANAAYEAGDYPTAVRLYRSLIERGHDSGFLHFNLGNAYLRNGELGRAIAAYRRSWLRLPRDEDVQANLEFARKTTQDALAAPGPSAVTSTLFFWHYGLSLAELQRAALALNALFWGVLALRLWRRQSEVLRWTTFLILLPLIAVLASLAVRVVEPQRVAVVVPQEINAQSGPGEDAVVRFKLHAGSEVALRGRRDGWLRIALPDGQQGWIEAEHAEIVEG